MSARLCGPSRRAHRTPSTPGSSTAAGASSRRAWRRLRAGERGQSLVEFALVLTPLLLILMGIIQMGFIFNAQVTLTNAVREAARAGTIYVYDGTSIGLNDTKRNTLIRTTLLSSMNMLRSSAPNFDAKTTGTASGAVTTGQSVTYDLGDLDIAYDVTGVVTKSDTRAGEKLTVTATYHQNLFFPLISAVLPRDSGGRLTQVATVTMVIN